MEKIQVLKIEEHWFLNFVKGCEYVCMGLCAFVGAWGSVGSQIIKPLFTQMFCVLKVEIIQTSLFYLQ